MVDLARKRMLDLASIVQNLSNEEREAAAATIISTLTKMVQLDILRKRKLRSRNKPMSVKRNRRAK